MSNEKFAEKFGITDNVSSVWEWINGAKVWGVNLGLDDGQLMVLKKECDDLFKQVTGSPICPAWYIGGWRRA